MGWRVVYLDGKEGRPFVECDTCKEIGRNVIEPAVIFVPIWKYNKYERKKKEAEKRFVELKQRESFLRDNFQKIFKEEMDNLKRNKKFCIFHCEKENEIWMENVEEYRQWKERRDKALREGKDFNEEIEIIWNKDLVDEFWRRVRAYRFAVDYVDLWEKSDRSWNKFIENIRNGDMAGKPGIIELKKK